MFTGGQTDRRRGGHFQIDSTIDADPSACYILFNESSIPFYSTSDGYTKAFQFLLGSEM